MNRTKKQKYWWLILLVFLFSGIPDIKADENHLDQNGYMKVSYDKAQGKFTMRYELAHMRKGGAFNLPSRIHYLHIYVNDVYYYTIDEVSGGADWSGNKSFRTYNPKGNNEPEYGKWYTGYDFLRQWSAWNFYGYEKLYTGNYTNGGWYTETHWYIPDKMKGQNIKIEYRYEYGYNWMKYIFPAHQEVTEDRKGTLQLWNATAESPIHEIKLDGQPTLDYDQNQFKVKWRIDNFSSTATADGSGRIVVEKKGKNNTWTTLYDAGSFNNSSSSGEVAIKLNKLSDDDLNSGFKVRVVRKRAPVGNSTVFTTISEESNTIKAFTFSSINASNLQNGKVKLDWTLKSSPSFSGSFAIERATNSTYTQNLKEVGLVSFSNGGSTSYTYEDEFPDRNKNNITYYYRIKPKSFGIWENKFQVTKSITVNTNYFTPVNPKMKDLSTGSGGIILSWGTTSDGVWEPGFKYRITMTTDGNAVERKKLDNKTDNTYTENNLPNCKSIVFNIDIINSAGMVINTYAYPAVVVRDPNATPSMESLNVSKGIHSNYVSLEWKAKKKNSDNFNRYVIYRKEISEDKAKNEGKSPVQLAIVEHQLGITDYRYEDEKALPGTYYEYTVAGQSMCNDTISTVASGVMSSIGFMQPFGVVTGRVSFQDGTTSVQNVEILVEGTDQMKNKSIDFNASAKTYIEIPYKENMLSETEFTFQAWIKIRDTLQVKPAQGFLSAGGRYNTMIQNNGKLGMEVFFKNGQKERIYFTEEVPLLREFKHITMSYKADPTAKKVEIKLYVDGKLIETLNPDYSKWETNGLGFSTTPSNNVFLGRGVSNDWHFDGNMDELRVWRKTLTDEEVKYNYNRYLSGKEENLSVYYRFDELFGEEVYDISGNSSEYNENHGKIYGTAVRSSIEIPTPNQLSIKGVTDKNGQFLINTIPYLSDGSKYTLTPALGVHTFSPSQKTLFFNKNTSTLNDINFTDISSFKVTGKVYYEGGTYPVEGCSFYVDEKILLKKDGSPITTGVDGKYEIYVPIGQHELKVAKAGHTFVDGGMALENEENIVFNDSISGLNFKDNTRVKLIGRVAGGKVENEKVLGFGESVNNIGATTLKLTASKSAYKLSDNLVESEFLHNNGEWKKEGKVEQDTTKMSVNGNDIEITVSPETGEFVAWVYPEFYEISETNIYPKENLLINKENIDLTNSAVEKMDMMPKSIRTWVDSIPVKGSGNQQDHKIAVEYSDTIYYNKDWKYFYQAVPKFSVKQMLGKNTVDYFGNETYEKENPITGKKEEITLFTKNETTGNIDYTFGFPTFTQATSYEFKLKAYEEYINKAKDNLVDIVKVNTGIAKISNDIELERTEPIQLDSIGEAVYRFYAGAPDLTTGIKEFQITLEIDNVSYYWDYGNTSKRAFLLGAKSTGTDFMTAGPDEITAVVHDPPGSLSYAYLEKGTTVTSTQNLSATGGIELEAGTTIDLGTKITTFVGLGAGVITDTEVIAETDIGVTTSTSFKYGNETETKTTFTERFETSSDPSYVGHMGDVFIGNSTNIQYGETNSITVLHKDEIDGVTNIKLPDSPDGDYVIAKSKGLAFGQTFGTRFAYTEIELEAIMIPKWKGALEGLLKQYRPDVSTLTEPFYYSKLDTDDDNFGKPNTDKTAFGSNASKSDKYYDGPSYEIIFPTGYLESEAMNSFVDSVIYFNNQVTRWEKALADNEKQKVEMKHIGNYSFGSGGKIEYSNSSSNSTTHSYDFSFVISPKVGIKAGTEICGLSMVVNATTTTSIGTEDSWSSGTEESKTIGFVLEEEGGSDQISVDYGWTEAGTIAFKSRGGRTSCPYEGEVRSKYFEPGKHVLSEGGMQIEVPVLTVKGGNYALKVPSNRPASFVLELKNESETSEDMWFKLLVDETTNPYGAELKIDGIGIGNGRNFLVKAGEVLEKTLTVTKGPNQDKYDDIKLLLTSQCQYDPTSFLDDIYDEIEVSVEFIPSCSDVTIKTPSDKWVVNTQTGDSIDIVLEGYDVNYSKFAYVELQYKPSAQSQWTSLMKFYADKALYDEATGAKTLLGNETEISYRWKMDQLSNGAYDLRARTVCESSGVIVSEYITTPISGIKDMVRPVLFGKAQPSDGVLRGTNDIMIQFNKDINEGLVTENNFTITGVKNGSVDNHFTSVHFDGISSEMSMEQEINFGGKSFTIEFWLKRDKLGQSTIFSHGQPGEEFSIGFTDNNNLQVSVGRNSAVTSSISSTNTSEWGHWAIVYDAENTSITAYYAAGSTNEILIDRKSVSAYNGMGIIKVGSNFAKSNYLAGNIHGLRIWDKALSLSKVNSNMNKILSGTEIGLIGYWPMNEGKGNMALDKAASRHAVLNTSWKILPEGKALSFNGTNSYLSINTSSTVAIDNEKDFTIEMWFKGDKANSALFSCGRGDGTDFNMTDKMSIFFDNKVLKFASNGKVHTLSDIDYLDNKWHHMAISVRRAGSANMYVDGNLVNYIDGLEVGSLASDQMAIGIRRWTEDTFTYKTDMPFRGEIDEVRIWDMALNQDFITNYYNTRLSGDETGLVAYYPFDTYVVNNNDKKELIFSLKDQVKDATTAEAVANNATSTAEIAPVKDAGPVSDYAFTVVTNKDKLILNLTEKNDIIEHTRVTITAKDIYDMNGNKMASPIVWNAYIDRSFLKWEEPTVSKTKKNGVALSFDVNIVNTGGNEEEYVIENIPSWLEITPSSGRVQPTSTKTLKFTVNEGLNPGIYEELLYLDGEYINTLVLKLNVGGEKPDWTVDPNKYEMSMAAIGQLKINEIISKDENDLIAAFIKGECVGVASPKYNKGYDVWQVMLNIYYSSTDAPIEFRIWDASTGKTYANVLPTDMVFKPNTLQGSAIAPVIFETTNAILQAIDLKTGWNWVSFNTQAAALRDVNSLFYGINNGLEIKGQQASIFSRYEASRNTWLNSDMGGSGLDNTQMYLVKMDGPNMLSVSGIPLDPSLTPITLKAGWNWISFVPQVNMTLSEAFSGLTPAEGDIVKSILGFAVYDAKLGWVGSLEYMKPNQGYMYKAAQGATFKYPSYSSLSKIALEMPIFEISAASKYENNLSLIGEVDLDTDIPESAQLIAKVNGEIRGTASVTRVGDKQLFFTSVHADNQHDVVSFSIIINNEEISLSERISFRKDEVVGSIEKPMILTTNDSKTLVYPNPFTDHLYIGLTTEESTTAKVTMHTVTGSLIFSSDYKVNTGRDLIKINERALASLAQGVYILRVNVNGNVETFKLIKRP